MNVSDQTALIGWLVSASEVHIVQGKEKSAVYLRSVILISCPSTVNL